MNMNKDCKIPEMVEILHMLNNWHDEIIHSFIVVDGRHLSNGIRDIIFWDFHVSDISLAETTVPFLHRQSMIRIA